MGRRSGPAAAVLCAAVLLGAPAAVAAPAPWSAPAVPPASATAPSSGAAASAGPQIGATSPTGAAGELPRLREDLAGVTTRAQQLADGLEQAGSRTAGIRQSADDLGRQQAAAQARLDARVRQVYMSGTGDRGTGQDVGGPAPVSAQGNAAPRSWAELAAAWTGLADPGGEVLAARGQRAALRVGANLVQAVAAHKAQAAELSAQAQQAKAALREQATAVLLAQDQARQLLADAEQAAAQQAAAEQAAAQRAAALAAADLASAQRAAQQRAAQQAVADARDQQLAAVRSTLDAVSASVTRSLSPAGRQLTVSQAPLLAALVTAGSGYPVGYRPTGQVVTGTASWYGPGFVGNPTASGAAYDPEQLSCANKELPLGTVLHVTANGRQVNCLVNDRGPYVGDRILDMSRAGSRALGYDGTTQVVVQILAAV